jgi:hypothetical protein
MAGETAGIEEVADFPEMEEAIRFLRERRACQPDQSGELKRSLFLYPQEATLAEGRRPLLLCV